MSDFEVLYSWMHQPHIAPFWKLNVNRDDFQAYLTRTLEASHKRVFLCFLDQKPAGYLIAYSIQHDPIKEYYQAEHGDLGMHLLIGPREWLNRDHGLMIARAMTAFLMEKYSCSRIIGEPDSRNRIVIPILKEMGGYVADTIYLPHKKATLIIGEKERFQEYMSNVNVNFIKLPTKEKDLFAEEGRSVM
jgi:RimJ/RimL family protein N-acetyltransferase